VKRIENIKEFFISLAYWAGTQPTQLNPIFFPYRAAQPAPARLIIMAQWPASAHAIPISDWESSPPKEFFPTVFFTRFLRILTES
jgi:hypothetical protein